MFSDMRSVFQAQSRDLWPKAVELIGDRHAQMTHIHTTAEEKI